MSERKARADSLAQLEELKKEWGESFDLKLADADYASKWLGLTKGQADKLIKEVGKVKLAVLLAGFGAAIIKLEREV